MRQVARLSEGGTQMFAENQWEAERGLPILSLQRPLALGAAPGQRRPKGIYSMTLTIFNMPCAFITPITISVIPAITSQLTLGDARPILPKPKMPRVFPHSSSWGLFQ